MLAAGPHAPKGRGALPLGIGRDRLAVVLAAASRLRGAGSGRPPRLRYRPMLNWVPMLLLGASAELGQVLFFDPGQGRHGVACSDCHATREDEGSGLLRAGHPLFGVAGRPHWRGDAGKRTYPTLADAIAPCARIYQGAARPDPASLAAIAAHLTGLGGKSRRPPLELRPDLRADGDYAQPRFLSGRPGPGRTLFYRACHGCHPHGTKEGLGGVLAGLPADRIVAKVREGTGLLRGAREPGAWMPFYGTDRLSDEQIAHIVAFIGALPPPGEDPASGPSR